MLQAYSSPSGPNATPGLRASARARGACPVSPMNARLLLIDDDARLTDMVGDYLQAAGFEIEVAPNLAAARRKLEQGVYDLAVLDIMLPDGDGLDFCREFSRRPARDGAPV